MKYKLLLLGVAVAAFFVGYGALAHAYPSPAPFGRAEWHGFFTNTADSDNGGGFVIQNTYSHPPQGYFAIPDSVNTASEFISYIKARYNDGNIWDETGASFIVDTMMWNQSGNSRARPSTSTVINNWSTAITNFVANGGSIDWFSDNYCYTLDTYYEYGLSGPGPKDDAFFGVSRKCTDSSFPAIVFTNPNGTTYAIRRQCGNPVGQMAPLQPAVPPVYRLTSSITVTSGGNPLPAGNFVEPGTPVTFAYNVNNTTSTTATGVTCTLHSSNYAGYNSTTASGPAPPGVTCTSTFTGGNHSLGTETIATAAPNTSYCRYLSVKPSVTGTTTTSAAAACVYVANEPYYRVYGGDVSAGNAQGNNCTATPVKAAIVGWTKDLTNYSGAATQYAALALQNIYDFSSSLGNAAGAAPAPSGLTFANTTASGHVFGGNFGGLPCMQDYYASKPAAPTGTFSGGNISSLGTGTYTATGPVTIHGNVNPGNRIVIYVQGNAIIDGTGIKYPGTWDIDHLPLLEIIASGSIYIDSGVDNIDGVLVAEASSTPGSGTIYTCTNGGALYSVDSTGSFYSPCSSKQLTINGALVAKQVQFLRTKGTVGQSSANEAAGTNQAETINYSPAFWMAQPPLTSAPASYDSITSLPPIL